MTVLATETAPDTSFAEASDISPRVTTRTEREGMMMNLIKFAAKKGSETAARRCVAAWDLLHRNFGHGVNPRLC